MRRLIAKNFKFDKKGLGKVLGSLEQEIMEALWDRRTCTGKEVLDDLARNRKIAKTTVFTVLERLYKKGLVRKSRGESFYLFEPAYSREELAEEVSREVLRGVLDLWSGPAISSFVDLVAQDSPDKLDRLASLVSNKKEELVKEEGR